MGFKCGIVGLPNVGKSTLFNALTATAAAEAANYPFCTIEPNIGKVNVPDKRLDELAKMAGSAKIIPTQIEFVDIAGLVKGASKGEGLGNQFLAHIREVDAILHVLRCFEDSDITHVEGSIDPVRDAEIIETELLLADLESIEKRIPNLEKKSRTGDKTIKDQLALLKEIKEKLDQGIAVRAMGYPEEEIKLLQLLTSKPLMYICNVKENEAKEGNDFTEQVAKKAAAEKASMVIISSQIEAEIAMLEEGKEDFLAELGLMETGLSQIIRAGYNLLNLRSFFTIGPKEAHAWTIKAGSKAPEAAGVIHTDFEKGFIRAETISYEDYIEYKGESGAKEVGKMRLEGKDYVVQDGDIMHFRFNI